LSEFVIVLKDKQVVVDGKITGNNTNLIVLARCVGIQ